MTHQHKALPYAPNALEPHLSAESFEYHWGKHLAAYVTNLNNLAPGTQWEGSSLSEIIKGAEGPIFNNAAQIFNHELFFDGLSPEPQTTPEGGLEAAIERDFGSFEAFKEQFNKTATTLFGSGWCFLGCDPSGKLYIVATHNADNPLREGLTPLMTLDVWEHAYYIDYRNARPKFIENFWNTFSWANAQKLYAPFL